MVKTKVKVQKDGRYDVYGSKVILNSGNVIIGSNFVPKELILNYSENLDKRLKLVKIRKGREEVDFWILVLEDKYTKREYWLLYAVNHESKCQCRIDPLCDKEIEECFTEMFLINDKHYIVYQVDWGYKLMTISNNEIKDVDFGCRGEYRVHFHDIFQIENEIIGRKVLVPSYIYFNLTSDSMVEMHKVFDASACDNNNDSRYYYLSNKIYDVESKKVYELDKRIENDPWLWKYKDIELLKVFDGSWTYFARIVDGHIERIGLEYLGTDILRYHCFNEELICFCIKNSAYITLVCIHVQTGKYYSISGKTCDWDISDWDYIKIDDCSYHFTKNGLEKIIPGKDTKEIVFEF
jgi:hypothetical protein